MNCAFFVLRIVCFLCYELCFFFVLWVVLFFVLWVVLFFGAMSCAFFALWIVLLIVLFVLWIVFFFCAFFCARERRKSTKKKHKKKHQKSTRKSAFLWKKWNSGSLTSTAFGLAAQQMSHTISFFPTSFFQSSWPKILTWVGRPGDIGVPHFQHLSAGILVVCLLQRLDVNPLPHLPAILLGIHTYIYIYCTLPPDTNSDHNSKPQKKHKKNQVVAPQYDFQFPLLRLDDQSNSLQVGSAVSAFSCHAQKSLLSKFDIGISNGMPHASSLSAPCGSDAADGTAILFRV